MLGTSRRQRDDALPEIERGALGRRWPLSVVSGALAITVYLTFTVMAYLVDPQPVSPTANWLSDLGNASLNPAGAWLYNFGVAITGLVLAGFFLGLRDWAAEGSPSFRRRLRAAQILGYVAAATTVSTAIVSESVDADLHGILSMTNIEVLASAIALAGIFLYGHTAFWRPIAWLALGIEAVAVIFGFVLHLFWVEWLAIGLVLVFVGTMALNMWMAFGPARRAGLGAHDLTP